LPKYERAEYKKKMAKKRAKDGNLAKGPQGSTADAELGGKTGPSTAQQQIKTETVPRKKKKQRK